MSSEHQGAHNTLASLVRAGEKLTYTAVYSYTAPGGKVTVTFEQKPPKSLLKSPVGEAIGTGTAKYYCSTSGSKVTCMTGGTPASNPVAFATFLFDPENAVKFMRASATQVAAKAQGFVVSTSTQQFAGIDSKCISVTAGQTGKYCVTKDGVLAYAGGSSAEFIQLTSYSTSVSDGDFSLPAGATIVTVPGVP